MRTLWIVLGAFMLSGCQGSGLTWGRSDPDAGPWALGFAVPYAMAVWVEDSATVDIDGYFFRRIGSGWISVGRKNGTDWSRGWSVGGANSERDVLGAKLPVRIYVRWQSLVEPQTYQGWVEIPESARQVMRNALTLDCPSFPEIAALSKIASVLFGLAPGGIVRVWVLDECRRPVEVTHAQVEIEPKGPELGLSNGSYFPMPEASKRYVEKHGIPYGSW